ncbi:MAG TPA: hypothetical protein VFT99_01780, partial [Roseiflexaceae bacterium]|nr:hypothetical protein [Roseiflexaceae bacterium]
MPIGQPPSLQPACAIERIDAVRCARNPLITAAMSPTIGDNINGPSVIRVPDWVDQPLGRYYLYFAHHGGDHIRLAYADALDGPWTIYAPGTLQLAQARGFQEHIASPDVHADHERREFRMYFHGPVGGPSQRSEVAISRDGLTFVPRETQLGSFYFRVFQWNGAYYAISKADNSGWGELAHSPDGLAPFTEARPFIRNARHTAVLQHGRHLIVWYSRVGDAPERILACTVDLAGPWTEWRDSQPIEVVQPEADYEGAGYANEPSRFGAATHVRQLRDPAIFAEDG